MTYKEAMQRIDTKRALDWLGIEHSSDGSYLKFQCPCGETAAVKRNGEKKNLVYCKGCKGGNIISLAMKLRAIEYLQAVEALVDKSPPEKPLEKELKLTYTLEYCEFLKSKGLPEDICRTLEVGRPKGKTMLSGCLVFTIRNEQGVKVAYYGLKPDGTCKYHQSFNPESYLYHPVSLDYTKEIILTTDMVKCLTYICDGKQACSNFGLPYLSQYQLEQLSQCEYLSLDWHLTDRREIAVGVAESLRGYYRFL